MKASLGKQRRSLYMKSSDRRSNFRSSAQTINFYKTGNTDQIKATALPGGKQMASKTLTYKSSNPIAVINSKGKSDS